MQWSYAIKRVYCVYFFNTSVLLQIMQVFIFTLCDTIYTWTCDSV